MLLTKQLMVPIDFHSIIFGCTIPLTVPVLVHNYYKEEPGYSAVFILKCSQKVIQVWNNMMVSKWWQIFFLWENVSLSVY